MAAVRYRDLADRLREQISEGTYPPGSMLPKVAELAQMHSRSISTVNAALKILQDEQLIRGIPKKGSVVLDRRPVAVDLSLNVPPGNGLGPWETCCFRAGMRGGMIMTGVSTEPAGPDIAQALQIAPDDLVVKRTRYATLDGGDGNELPVRLDAAYYPLALVEGTAITRTAKIVGGIYGALAEAGLAPVSIAWELVGSRTATVKEAEQLRIPRGAWVLTIDRVTRDGRERHVELLRFVANPTRIRILNENLPLGGGA